MGRGRGLDFGMKGINLVLVLGDVVDDVGADTLITALVGNGTPKLV